MASARRMAGIERAVLVAIHIGIAFAVLASTVVIAFAQSAAVDKLTGSGTVFAPSGAEAIARKAGDDLIPSCNFAGGNCGYVDRDGKIVIAPQFDSVERFRDDRAIVVVKGLYGAIDRAGRFAVPATFGLMSPFGGGVAQVLTGGKLGIIDRDGREIIPAQYGGIVRLSPDTFLVAEPPYQEARAAGFESLAALDEDFDRYHPYIMTHNRKWGVVMRGGAWLIQPTYAKVMPLSDEPNGLFWAANSPWDDADWRLLRVDGTAVTGEVFHHVQSVQKGQDRAIVARDQKLPGEPETRNRRRWGAVNGRGDIAVPLEYDWLSYYRDGYAVYRRDGSEGRIDKDGNVLSIASDPPAGDQSAAPFAVDKTSPTDQLRPSQRPASEGLAASFDESTRKWGFFDITGTYTIPPRFDAAGSFRKGLAWAAFPEQQEWCLIDKQGQPRSDRPCQCSQPLVIVERYSPPSKLSCYDAGLAVIGIWK